MSNVAAARRAGDSSARINNIPVYNNRQLHPEIRPATQTTDGARSHNERSLEQDMLDVPRDMLVQKPAIAPGGTADASSSPASSLATDGSEWTTESTQQCTRHGNTETDMSSDSISPAIFIADILFVDSKIMLLSRNVSPSWTIPTAQLTPKLHRSTTPGPSRKKLTPAIRAPCRQQPSEMQIADRQERSRDRSDAHVVTLQLLKNKEKEKKDNSTFPGRQNNLYAASAVGTGSGIFVTCSPARTIRWP